MEIISQGGPEPFYFSHFRFLRYTVPSLFLPICDSNRFCFPKIGTSDSIVLVVGVCLPSVSSVTAQTRSGIWTSLSLAYLSSVAFGRLSHRVLNLTISTKVAIYNATCVSVLLFGCEIWTLYRRHFKALEAYHAKSLQKILGLHRWHKVPHTEMRSRANTHSMEHLVMQHQLRWIGHVIR